MSEDTRRIQVSGPPSYEVVVGHHLLADLPAMLPSATERVAVIAPRALAATGTRSEPTSRRRVFGRS